MKKVSMWLGFSQKEILSWMEGEESNSEEILRAFHDLTMIGINDVTTRVHRLLEELFSTIAAPGIYNIVLRKSLGAGDIINHVTTLNEDLCLVKKKSHLDKMALKESVWKKIVYTPEDNPCEYWEDMDRLSRLKPIIIITDTPLEKRCQTCIVPGISREDTVNCILSVFDRELFPGNLLDLLSVRINGSWPLLLKAVEVIKDRTEAGVPLDSSLLLSLKKGAGEY